ncbi:hypothetical protein RQP46_005311 [Phenoliferia psychrophenolica]
MSTPAPAFDVSTWDQHLSPLLKIFKSLNAPKDADVPPPDEWITRFTDSDGNHLDFGHTKAWCYQRKLITLLESRKTGMYQVDEVDRGRLFYVVQKLAKTTTAPTRWVVSSVKLDLYGYIGGKTDHVVVDETEMVKLIEMVRKLEPQCATPNAVRLAFHRLGRSLHTLDFADHCGWQLGTFKAKLGSLLASRMDGVYELEVDNGHWFYVVKKYDESWVVSSVTYDLYGESGGKTDFVVVDEEGIKRLEKVVRELKDEEE